MIFQIMFVSYYDKTVKELKEECKKLGLSFTGKKILLVQRLFPESKNYKYLDEKKWKLAILCIEFGLKVPINAKWAELISALNMKTRPFSAQISRLDSSKFMITCENYSTVGELKEKIISQEGIDNIYVDLYSTEKILFDSEYITADVELTMIINIRPNINPYSGRCLPNTSSIIKNLIKCYSEPDVCMIADGTLLSIDYFTNGKIESGHFFYIQLIIPKISIDVVEAKIEYVEHLIHKLKDTVYLEELSYRLLHLEYIKKYGVLSRNGKYWSTRSKRSCFIYEFDKIIDWKFHSFTDYEEYLLRKPDTSLFGQDIYERYKSLRGL